ncbi:hypothetical protein K2Z84_04065 [Candidatus Binatia bacterium]|nr:hypothetical protein [Candidatus Binatia bacterium]
MEEYARDFVAKVVAELREHGELLTVTYLLVGDDYVLVPAFYRTSLEKLVATVAIDALMARLGPRAVFYVTRGWVSDVFVRRTAWLTPARAPRTPMRDGTGVESSMGTAGRALAA